MHGFRGLLVLDLAALALLGAWVERRSRRAFVSVVLCAALAASLAVLLLTSLERYVGSSALATALLVNGAVVALRKHPRSLEARIALLALALLAAKILLEALGSWPAALGSLPDGVEPVAVAHLAGALVGWAFALLVRRTS